MRLFTMDCLIFRQIKIPAKVTSLKAYPYFHVIDRPNEREKDREN